MISPIDPRRLETFRVVALTGQVSGAAAALHLSQPAVTAQIRQLERDCGAPLFARTPRGVVLNAAGRALLERAKAIRALLDEAAAVVQSPSEPTGVLALAASTTLASYVVPGLLAAFAAQHPAVGIRLEVANTAEVLGWVKANRVPLGLVEGHARAAGARLERFLDDELLPIVAGDAPPALRRLSRVAQLERVRVIWREPGSGTRAVVERALRGAGSRRRPRPDDLQLASTEAIKVAAAHGLGVAFLSRWSIQQELAVGRLRPLALRGLRITRSLSWALPAEDPSGVAGHFLRFARGAAPTFEHQKT